MIAAEYSGADVKFAPGFEFGVTNKQDNFLQKFPQGKVSTIKLTVFILLDNYVKVHSCLKK